MFWSVKGRLLGITSRSDYCPFVLFAGARGEQGKLKGIGKDNGRGRGVSGLMMREGCRAGKFWRKGLLAALG